MRFQREIVFLRTEQSLPPQYLRHRRRKKGKREHRRSIKNNRWERDQRINYAIRSIFLRRKCCNIEDESNEKLRSYVTKANNRPENVFALESTKRH